MAVADVGKKDFMWTLASMILKVGAGVLLYPFILSSLSTQAVGIWTIFGTIGTLTILFDFGFNQSFTRNISYIFSGVGKLQKQGYENIDNADDCHIDYGLLRSTIKAMKKFYSKIAIALFLIFITVGTYYIHVLLDDYTGDRVEVYISWLVVCALNCYLLYTMYYESMLMGKGLVKRANQIVLLGNMIYLVAAIVLLSSGFGLLAVVSSQALSIIVIRILSYKTFYTKELKSLLADADDSRYSEVIKAISPNAVKLGLTSLGGFIINKSSTFIGSLYVSLDDMASYGISMQILLLIAQIANVLTRVYLPKIYQWRVENNTVMIRRMFWLTSVFVLGVFVVCGAVVVLLGNWALDLVHSNTFLLPTGILVLMIVQRYLESNHANAADFLTSKNEVPFFRASLISAAAVLILLYIFEVWMGIGVLGMVLAPTIVQAVYQNWRWPLMVITELHSSDKESIRP